MYKVYKIQFKCFLLFLIVAQNAALASPISSIANTEYSESSTTNTIDIIEAGTKSLEDGGDTELDDLLMNTKANTGEVNGAVIQEIQEEDLFKKNGTDWIDNGENTEDRRVQIRLNNPIILEQVQQKNSAFVTGQWAIFLLAVGSTVFISLTIYAVLLTRRKYSESKYGSSAILINEDDFTDPNDMKHFSI